MGFLDKIADKTNELTEKAEKTYKEAITPEYREKISRGIDKIDKGIDNAADKVADFFSGDKK